MEKSETLKQIAEIAKPEAPKNWELLLEWEILLEETPLSWKEKFDIHCAIMEEISKARKS